MRFENAEFEAAYGTFAQLPPSEIPEIAFSGRSNVGKSSLMNRLFRRKSLARVSGVPGKTITINFYKVDEIYFVDLPGYGYAKVARSEKERWAEMMEGYFNSERRITLVVQLIDMRHAPSQDDLGMIEFLRSRNIPFIIAMTKSDKLKKKSQREDALKVIEKSLAFLDNKIPLIPFSAENGEGAEELKALIEQAISSKG